MRLNESNHQATLANLVGYLFQKKRTFSL